VPRYDYDCAACGTRFEAVHGVHADPPTACPSCGGGPIKKAFAPPTIHFKGSGWAKKERRTSTPGRTAAASPEGATSSAADGGSGESAGADGSATASTGSGAKPSAASSTATSSD
jgi:putative FmdB family regulatory protein